MAKVLVEQLGVADFVELRCNLAVGRGLIALGNDVWRIRSLCKYALGNLPHDLGQTKMLGRRLMNILSMKFSLRAVLVGGAVIAWIICILLPS